MRRAAVLALLVVAGAAALTFGVAAFGAIALTPDRCALRAACRMPWTHCRTCERGGVA